MAGYQRWRELGHQVRKGERGIAILAPLVRKAADDDGETRPRVVAYRVVHVFDVDQTEGEPLETVGGAHDSARVGTEVDENVWAMLVALARSLRVPVELTQERHPAMAGAHGWFDPAERSITVRDEGSGPASLTLLHELGHALDSDFAVGAEQCRAVGEIVAQSVAYLFGASLGVDVGEVSAVYLASWQADAKAIEAVASKVLGIVSQLEEARQSLRTAEMAA